MSNTQNKVTMNNVKYSDIDNHFIELSQPTTSADTLEFGDTWAQNDGIYHVTNHKIYGFKLNNKGNLVQNKYPIASLENVSTPKLDDKNAPIKDDNGHTEYHSVPGVVYQEKSDPRNPYEKQPDWLSAPLWSNDDHSQAVALLESVQDYVRGFEDVSYDPAAPTLVELVDNTITDNVYVDNTDKNVVNGGDTNNDGAIADDGFVENYATANMDSDLSEPSRNEDQFTTEPTISLNNNSSNNNTGSSNAGSTTPKNNGSKSGSTTTSNSDSKKGSTTPSKGAKSSKKTTSTSSKGKSTK